MRKLLWKINEFQNLKVKTKFYQSQNLNFLFLKFRKIMIKKGVAEYFPLFIQCLYLKL
jgi:hypothetical protein